MQQEVRTKQIPEPTVFVHVTKVKFDPDSEIPQDIQNEISRNETGRTHEEDADSDYLADAAGEIADVAVRGALQNSGYFRVLTNAKLTVLKAKGQDIEVVANVSAEMGDQYRMGEVRFEPADPEKALLQSLESLRELIPLKRGEILDIEKIREGMRNLTSMYGEDGYIDFTAEPEFNIHEESRIIDMTIRLDLQKQYRIRKIEFWGVEPKLERQLRESYQRSGEVFSKLRLEQFVQENMAIVPRDVEKDEVVEFHRDTKEGMVDLTFDLRSCPGTWK